MQKKTYAYINNDLKHDHETGKNNKSLIIYSNEVLWLNADGIDFGLIAITRFFFHIFDVFTIYFVFCAHFLTLSTNLKSFPLLLLPLWGKNEEILLFSVDLFHVFGSRFTFGVTFDTKNQIKVDLCPPPKKSK